MAKTAVLFPGQGSQYIGMGKELFQSENGQKIFQTGINALGESFVDLINNGSEEELRLTFNAQPAILLVSIAAWEMLKSLGIKPDYMAGHSLGEYSAYVAADSIELADGLKAVRKRGELMQKAFPPGLGGMAALLGLGRDAVIELCEDASEGDEIVVPANYNNPIQIVISGHIKAVERAINLAKERGAKRAVSLAVSGPFHSPFMKCVEKDLAEVLNTLTWSHPNVPVVSNVHAQPVNDAQEGIKLLTVQVSSAVRWEETIRYLVEQGVEIFVECGPGKVLSGLIRKIAPEAKTLNIEDLSSFEKSLASLKESGYNVAE